MRGNETQLMMKKQLLNLLVLIALVSVSQSVMAESQNDYESTEISSTQVSQSGKTLKPITPGYEQSIDIYGFVSNTYGGGGVSYIGGYRFSNAVFIGLGVGISGEEHSTDYNAQTGPILRDWLTSFPVFLHLRTYFTQTRFQPFLAILVGGKFSAPVDYKNENYSGDKVNTSGFIFAPAVCVNWRLDDMFSFYLKAGYDARFYPTFGGYVDDELLISRQLYHGLSLSLGITF